MRRADVTQLQQCIRIIDDKPHGLKADHCEEQADTGCDPGTKRGGNGPDQPAAKPRQREQQEQNGCDEHGGERLLPAELLAENEPIGKIGVETHARGDGNRPSGPKPHDRRAKRRRQNGRDESGLERDACILKEHRVDGDDEGHRQECAYAGENLAAKGGPGVGKSEKPVHV